MLELKNVLEVVRETSPEPTGIVLTQVIDGLVLNHVHLKPKWQVAVPGGRWDTRAGQIVQVSFLEIQYPS